MDNSSRDTASNRTDNGTYNKTGIGLPERSGLHHVGFVRIGFYLMYECLRRYSALTGLGLCLN